MSVEHVIDTLLIWLVAFGSAAVNAFFIYGAIVASEWWRNTRRANDE